QHEFEPFARQLIAMSIDKAVRHCGVRHQRLLSPALKKRLLLRVVELEPFKDLIAETPERRATQWTSGSTLHHRTASQRECAEQQMHRRPDHLVEIAGAGNLLAQVGKRSECV